MTELEAIRARHAVRKYMDKSLPPEIIGELKEEIEKCNRIGQLHIQLATENGEVFKSPIPLLGRFKNVKNYIVLAAERQGDFYERCGYYGARLMIKAQQAGLNSCFVTNTFNAKKCQVSLAPNEVVVGVIAIGYGLSDGKPHKSKSMDSLCTPCREHWFTAGMQAAILAPTGLNKQNFFIEADGNTAAIRTKDNSPLSQISAGIVKYHFEIGAGPENFSWI